MVTTLDRLVRSTSNMLALAQELQEAGVGLRVLNLGGGDVTTSTTMGAMLLTIMAALAQAERDIKTERIVDSVAKRRAAGRDLGGRRQKFTDSQIANAAQLIAADKPAAQVEREPGMSTSTLYRRLGAMPPAEQ